MRFRKIKYADGVVTLESEDKPTKDREEQRVVTSREKPHPDFLRALRDLAEPAVALCELPGEYGDGIEVRSVSISRDDDGHEGCVVTMLKTLESVPAPLVLNTPHVSERGHDEGRATMPDGLRYALDRLVREARAYLTGKREQADLFNDQTTVSVNGTRVADEEEFMQHVGAAVGRTMREAKRHGRGRAAASPTIEAD